jgi:hypothetical protein
MKIEDSSSVFFDLDNIGHFDMEFSKLIHYHKSLIFLL